MLITATCPNDIGEPLALFHMNNNFEAIFNEEIKLPPYSKICVHSAYISFAPYIEIIEGLNDQFTFVFKVPPATEESTSVYIPAGFYTPQQLADVLALQINDDLYPFTDQISAHIDWNVISGTYSFFWTFQQPVAGATDGIREIQMNFDTNDATRNLGRILGYVSSNQAPTGGTFNRITSIVLNSGIAEGSFHFEGDYSLTYTTNANATPVAFISIENINSRNWNNYSAQALRFLETIRYTYPQNLNNTFILPYEKSWIYMDNTDEIILNSLNISIRELDGRLMRNLDASKQVIVVFEIVQDRDRLYQIEQMKAIKPEQVKKLDAGMSEIMMLLEGLSD